MAAVPKAIRLPTAAERRPSSRARHATAVVATIAPIGACRRSTLRRNWEAGRTSSRAMEKIVLAVNACAAIPQARNATRTTAAKGFADHEPNDVTTAVDTGSRSRPATTSAGFGCASVAATALRMTTAATLSSALRLLGGGDTGIEADEHPAADRQRGEHAGADRSAGEALGTKCVREERDVLRPEHEQQREPDPDGCDRFGPDPDLDHAAEHVDAERTDDCTDEHEHDAGGDDRVGRGRDSYKRQSPGCAEVGDRRVRDRIRTDRHPAAEPAVRAAHQAAAPLVRAAGERNR